MSQRKYVISAEQIASLEGDVKTHLLNPKAIRLDKSLGDMEDRLLLAVYRGGTDTMAPQRLHVLSFSSL
jgi:hypothetical protein